MKLKAYIGFLCGIFLMKNAFCLFEEFAGPFYLRPKGVSKCDYKGQGLITGGIKLLRYNRTALALRINMTFPFVLDNNVLIRTVFVNKGTNGYTWNIVLNKTKGFCDFTNEYLEPRSFIDSTKKRHNCTPFKGTHTDLFPLAEPFCNPLPMIPVFPYGDYRLEVSFYTKNGTSIVRQFCAWGFTEIRPSYETNGRCK